VQRTANGKVLRHSSFAFSSVTSVWVFRKIPSRHSTTSACPHNLPTFVAGSRPKYSESGWVRAQAATARISRIMIRKDRAIRIFMISISTQESSDKICLSTFPNQFRFDHPTNRSLWLLALLIQFRSFRSKGYFWPYEQSIFHCLDCWAWTAVITTAVFNNHLFQATVTTSAGDSSDTLLFGAPWKHRANLPKHLSSTPATAFVRYMLPVSEDPRKPHSEALACHATIRMFGKVLFSGRLGFYGQGVATGIGPSNFQISGLLDFHKFWFALRDFL